ncbi:MAG: hypothetical protein N3A72_06010 [bacterium]|nr:hypothetical protein [bacterium]
MLSNIQSSFSLVRLRYRHDTNLRYSRIAKTVNRYPIELFYDSRESNYVQ